MSKVLFPQSVRIGPVYAVNVGIQGVRGEEGSEFAETEEVLLFDFTGLFQTVFVAFVKVVGVDLGRLKMPFSAIIFCPVSGP